MLTVCLRYRMALSTIPTFFIGVSAFEVSVPFSGTVDVLVPVTWTRSAMDDADLPPELVLSLGLRQVGDGIDGQTDTEVQNTNFTIQTESGPTNSSGSLSMIIHDAG